MPHYCDKSNTSGGKKKESTGKKYLSKEEDTLNRQKRKRS
jgi:hypothetical protein